MKYLLTLSFLFFSSLAYSWNVAPGVWQGANQGMAASQQREMNQVWIDCMKQGGGADCGPAPQQQAPQQYQQPVKQTDYRCVQRCTTEGNMYGLCVNRCSW